MNRTSGGVFGESSLLKDMIRKRMQGTKRPELRNMERAQMRTPEGVELLFVLRTRQRNPEGGAS